jgi:hypothetical protein
MEENKPDEPKTPTPAPVNEPAVSEKPSPKQRPLGMWASILALVFAGLYVIRAILTICSGSAYIINNVNNSSDPVAINVIVGEYLLAALSIFGFVVLLISGLHALKKTQVPSSPFVDFSLLYFWIGLLVCANSLVSLICFGFDGNLVFDLIVGVAVAVLGYYDYAKKDGTLLENQIIFYVASGLAFTVGSVALPGSFQTGWYAFYDIPHAFVPLAFYVLCVLSVIFEEKKAAK